LLSTKVFTSPDNGCHSEAAGGHDVDFGPECHACKEQNAAGEKRYRSGNGHFRSHDSSTSVTTLIEWSA
jgi:hypothetical protein